MNDDPFDGLDDEERAILEAEMNATLKRANDGSRLREDLRRLVTPAFVDVADWLLEKAKADGYAITHDDGKIDPEQLGIAWFDGAIYINVTKREPSPNVVWDLIHEIGHIPNGKAPDNQTKEQKMAWERQAWEKGWEMALAKFPWLKEHEADFWKLAEKRIATYEKWDSSMAKKG